jgi:uncharacterized OB-fold protein
VAVPLVGTIYSFARVWHPVLSVLEQQVPYVVVVVELAEHSILYIGNLVGDPLVELSIGDAVSAVFEDHGEENVTLVQWRLVTAVSTS